MAWRFAAEIDADVDHPDIRRSDRHREEHAMRP